MASEARIREANLYFVVTCWFVNDQERTYSEHMKAWTAEDAITQLRVKYPDRAVKEIAPAK